MTDLGQNPPLFKSLAGFLARSREATAKLPPTALVLLRIAGAGALVVGTAIFLTGIWQHFSYVLPHAKPPDPYPGPASDLIEGAAEFHTRLQFLWGRYMDMIQLSITLLTGSLAVAAGLVKVGRPSAVASRGIYAMGMTSLLIALASASMWRIDAQLLMEIEIFGSPSKTKAFFDSTGVKHAFTTSYEYADYAGLYGTLADYFMVAAAVGFILGLSLLSYFTFRNLPEGTRAASPWRDRPIPKTTSDATPDGAK